MVKITLENGTRINFPMAESELREVLKTKEKRVIEVLETEIALIKEIIDTKYDYFKELTLSDGQILELNNWVIDFNDEILEFNDLTTVNALVEGGIIEEYAENYSIRELKSIIEELVVFEITRENSLTSTIESDIGRSMVNDYGYLSVPSDLENYIDYSRIGRDILFSGYDFLKESNLLVRKY